MKIQQPKAQTRTSFLSLLLFCAIALSGCSTVGGWFDGDDKTRLEGERISVLELQKTLEPESRALDAQGFVAPAPWRNEFWPQAGGYPNHAMQHLALNEGGLAQIWTSSIGRGSTKALPLTAQPIVVDGRVFTLDTDSKLSAFNAENGERIWRVDVKDKAEDDPVIGGGVAYSRGRLFVTNGYDEILAINPDDGAEIWRQTITAPSRAAPTVMNERVFVVTLDNRVLALSAETGESLWDYSGVAEMAGLIGAASPAASRDVLIPVFSSGDIVAMRVENGSVAWTENLSTFSAQGGLSAISDIRGLPVIDKGLVIAISFGGRMVAIDERTGTRIWQRDIAGAETPWVAGNHLFVITTDNELVALGRDNGVIRWVSELPRYENMEKRKDSVFWTGPLLAGERLIAVSSGGMMLEIEPIGGTMIRQTDIKKSVRIAPVIAGSTLYMLAEDGTLMAYR